MGSINLDFYGLAAFHRGTRTGGVRGAGGISPGDGTVSFGMEGRSSPLPERGKGPAKYIWSTEIVVGSGNLRWSWNAM